MKPKGNTCCRALCSLFFFLFSYTVPASVKENYQFVSKTHQTTYNTKPTNTIFHQNKTLLQF